MRLLSSGPEDPMNGLVRDDHPVFPTIAQPYVLPNAGDEQEGAQRFDILGLLRRYWLLLLASVVVGSAAGFISIVLSSPMYKTLLYMEVQNTNSAMPQRAGM
jgi:hypothetical protein